MSLSSFLTGNAGYPPDHINAVITYALWLLVSIRSPNTWFDARESIVMLFRAFLEQVGAFNVALSQISVPLGSLGQISISKKSAPFNLKHSTPQSVLDDMDEQ